jgi:Electron transfer flavoprotein, alpha subunit
MSKLQSAWVIAETSAAIPTLSAGAAQFGEATAIVQCEGLETETWLSYIPAIVEKVKERTPSLVLVEATKNGRLTAAAIATAMGTSVLTDGTELKIEYGAVVSKCMVYGGAAFKTEKATGTVVACVGSATFEADGTIATELITVKSCAAGVRLVETRQKETQTVNLAAAKVIVGVGRGFSKAENVHLAQELAAAVGGEVGCSRPVAEEEKWMPKELYIGVSGAMIKPDVYIGCGISGQIQHMVGINQSKVIVAVNKDKNAPIFKQCDYGIVGDLNTVLPALTKKFQN